jgi:spoIIIJ-associated protein
VLQRAFSPQLEGRALHAECEGFREQRDAALAEEARRLAEAVRADGAPRTTEPLNAYERRIVHLAIGEVAGVITYSVGEGAGRRVTVAPAPEGAKEAAPGAVDRDGAV